jgi:hypothetical protein
MPDARAFALSRRSGRGYRAWRAAIRGANHPTRHRLATARKREMSPASGASSKSSHGESRPSQVC